MNSGVKRCWPLAGSSRGVGSRDGTHKKAPETRGGIRGRTCPGLDPGRPAQGGGAGKTICPTVSVKYRPKHFVRVPVAVDPQSILASFVQVLRRWDRRLQGHRKYDPRDEGGRAASGTAAESNGRFRRPCLTRHLCSFARRRERLPRRGRFGHSVASRGIRTSLCSRPRVTTSGDVGGRTKQDARAEGWPGCGFA